MHASPFSDSVSYFATTMIKVIKTLSIIFIFQEPQFDYEIMSSDLNLMLGDIINSNNRKQNNGKGQWGVFDVHV